MCPSSGPFSIFSTFIVSYRVLNLKFSKQDVLHAVTLTTAVSTLMIPLMGALSDRFGRKRMYYIGTVAIILFALPYFCNRTFRPGTSGSDPCG